MFEGIITPIVTPIQRDEKECVNLEAMKQLVDHLIEKGVSGIFPLGSNGEFHVLSNQEKMDVAKAVIEQVNGRVPVFNCGNDSVIKTSRIIGRRRIISDYTVFLETNR